MFAWDEPKRVHSKYAVTLLGPRTLLLPETEVVTEMLGQKNSWKEEMRGVLAEGLKGEPVTEVREGEVVRFTWGEEDSPVHSEPDMSAGDRVFVSVLYGSERELRCMCEWRKQVYRQ